MKNLIFPFLLLVFAQFVWAISWLFTKKAMNILPIFLIYAFEALIGFVIILPLIIYFSKGFFHLSKVAVIWMIIASITTVLGAIVYYLGFQKIPFIFASLTTLVFPFFVAFLSIMFLHEQLTLKFFIAAALMVAGFLVLVL
ncbi:MAG: DMT family transporter [Patescibacteria group bacterium]